MRSSSSGRGVVVGDVAEVMRLLRVVHHDLHAAAAEDVAAVVGVELDRFLGHHDEVAGLVVGGEEFGGVVHFVHVLPAAAVRGLHEDRPAEVLEDLVPVRRGACCGTTWPRCWADASCAEGARCAARRRWPLWRRGCRRTCRRPTTRSGCSRLRTPEATAHFRYVR